MNANDSSALAIKLNRLTSQGKLSWAIQEPPRTLLRGTDFVIPVYLGAIYKGNRFGLYEQRYQAFNPDNEQFYWTERIVLVILNYNDTPIWEAYDNYAPLHDLLQNARSKAANIDGVIKDILAEEEEDGDS